MILTFWVSRTSGATHPQSILMVFFVVWRLRTQICHVMMLFCFVICIFVLTRINTNTTMTLYKTTVSCEKKAFTCALRTLGRSDKPALQCLAVDSRVLSLDSTQESWARARLSIGYTGRRIYAKP